MVYIRGGGAWVDTQLDMRASALNVTVPGFFFGANGPNAAIFDVKYSGWTIGGGFEWMVATNWSAFIEYNYYDFRSKSLYNAISTTAGANPNVRGNTLDSGLNISTVTVGVNYRFNWAGPLVARY
jgi:outer membrane immunogenic protein